MLGLGNARLNQLEAENRTLRAELDAARRDAAAMKQHLINAWREHGVYSLTDGERAANAVTAAGALSRICVN